ncbi:ATP-dependent RNA helicase DeaD [compost metagenome]
MAGGQDTLALLPTGGGKSVCFQVPALMKEGICIVVSPLIALMKDQVENLKAKGIPAIAIYAGMGKREIDILLDNCIYGSVKFLYLSPERLLSELVRTRISHMKVNLIAVDEAHCISQWGYDFRPPYLQLKNLRELHPDVPVLALTATATERVRADIQEKLMFKKPRVFVKSFARKNLSYVVFGNENKEKKLLEMLRGVKGCGLIYVRNRRETAEVASFLIRNGVSADFYHAGLTIEERAKKQEAWRTNRLRIIVATNAFGMGIDKPDVRIVVHLDLPESMEAYYQEAGRAGRDEKRAYAVLLANKADQLRLKAKYDDNFPTAEEVKKVYHHLGNYFQLAYGAGEGLYFDFDAAAFCRRFQLSIHKTLTSLKLLERDGYLTLSESNFLPSRFMFVASHEDVYRFQIENKGYDLLIKTIQRSYGGTFEHYVNMDETELARRMRTSSKALSEGLFKLREAGILSYLPQSEQPQIQFIRPRTDQLHLDIDAKYIRLRHQIQTEQINSIISYSVHWLCRSKQLLHYFGERNAGNCGCCDVCLAEKKKAQYDQLNDRIDFEIISGLQHHALSLDDLLIKIISGTEQEKIARIRELLDAGKIKTDGMHYYI